ncbi:transglutaminase-like domain-containing protein [Tundrisphaera lichenicola]|uniref:transglutaminase-like domain-containing protein n=1 Tax=Tundrisphaera lichenicola TaxID=2029860 RepID=UPI003EB79337
MSLPRSLTILVLLIMIPRSTRADSSVVDVLPAEYRSVVAAQLEKAGENAGNLSDAIREAPPEHREAVGFLVANMPELDLKGLGKDFLLKNVRLAYLAREATPWASKIPEELFFDAVLPYASVNERRDDWRQDFYDRFIAIAKECPSATEAVKRLNVEAFQAFNVQYHATKRPKPDQSPYESAKAGYASCTGLSILLIDACRAVGIPARMVGTPRWTDNSGNHSWVEVWDREWSFVGACEPSKLNEGWFIEKASQADESNPRHRIYATSFKATDTYFPMVWKRSARDVPAEDVTRRYTLRRKVRFQSPDAPGQITVRRSGRIVAQAPISDPVTFELPGDLEYQVQIRKSDGSEGPSRTVKLSAEPDQVVEIR